MGGPIWPAGEEEGLKRGGPLRAAERGEGFEGRDWIRGVVIIRWAGVNLGVEKESLVRSRRIGVG